MQLSIIIPCYNSARFIADTLDMLIAQGLEDCEVIVVNDGSTDETASIVLKFAEKNAAIHLVDKQSEGVSVARNTGMKAAKGKYIYFLDSDDTLTDGTLDFFRKTLAENPCNTFFAFGYYSKYKGRLLKDYAAKQFDCMTLSSLQLKQSFFSKKLCFHICSCIYESNFLREHKLVFTLGVKFAEDVEFLLKVMQFTSDCVYNARHCFVYQIRDDSTMQGYKYSANMFYAFLHIKECVERYTEKSSEKLANYFIDYNYISNLVYYLRSKGKSEAINTLFLRNRKLLYRKTAFVSFPVACALFILRVIPLRFLFLFWK